MTEEQLQSAIRATIHRELTELRAEAEHALRMGDAYVYADPRKLINLFVRLDNALWAGSDDEKEPRTCRGCGCLPSQPHAVACWAKGMHIPRRRA